MLSISPFLTHRKYASWTAWKAAYVSRGSSIQYETVGQVYVIWFYDGTEAHICDTIWTGNVPQSIIDAGYSQSQNDTDKSDFETNYLSTANARFFGQSDSVTTGSISVIGNFGIIGYGTINSTTPTSNSYVDMDVSSYASVMVTMTGTWSGLMCCEATSDGTNWFTVNGLTPGAAGGTFPFSFAAAGFIRLNVGGYKRFRVRAPSSVTSITSATVNIRATNRNSIISVDQIRVGGMAGSGTGWSGNPVGIGCYNPPSGKVIALTTDSNGVLATQSLASAVTQGLCGNASGRIVGRVTTVALTEVAARNSTYTEQSSGAQRSIKSSSVNDISAGTGARTVRVTYYTLSGATVAGPFTEDLTLNGTSAVNTVATNICYVEKMEIITVGSGLVAAGNIQLFTTTGGGGSAFVTLNAAERVTKLGLHYVPSGFTCYILDVLIANEAATTQQPSYVIRFRDPTNAASAERELLDAFEVQGNVGSLHVPFGVPRVVAGPAVLTFYVTPTNTASQVHKIEASFYEL